MSDYIKKSGIQYGYYPIAPILKGGSIVWRHIAFKSEIDAMPSADVAPVRHGHWFQDAIYYGEDGSPCIVDICTECGAYGDYADYNYCPNCGARMDGENDE